MPNPVRYGELPGALFPISSVLANHVARTRPRLLTGQGAVMQPGRESGLFRFAHLHGLGLRAGDYPSTTYPKLRIADAGYSAGGPLPWIGGQAAPAADTAFRRFEEARLSGAQAVFVRSELPDGLNVAGYVPPTYLGCPNAIARGKGGNRRWQLVPANGQQADTAPLHSSDWANARGAAAARATWARAASLSKIPGPGGYKATEAGSAFGDGGAPAELVHTLGTYGEQAKAVNTGLSPIAGASESQNDHASDGAASFSSSPGGPEAVHDQLATKQQVADTERFAAGVASAAIRAVPAPGMISTNRCRLGERRGPYGFYIAEGETCKFQVTCLRDYLLPADVEIAYMLEWSGVTAEAGVDIELPAPVEVRKL